MAVQLKESNGRLARWALELQCHRYEIEHRKGSLNCVPDALSHMFEGNGEPELSSLQMVENTDDLWYTKMYQQAQATLTEHPYYKIVLGRLYRHQPNPAIEDRMDDHASWKLVIPKEKRERFLHECHDEPTAGHYGRHKTYELVTLYYYWPSLHKDVMDYVRSCPICQ